MSIVQDVKLQMDAKLWAEEYNRHNPPKKVLIKISTCIATSFFSFVSDWLSLFFAG